MMPNDVFANGREISCKAASGKSICAFPDVCFTPPENPATPPGVPIPYPNTGMAKDTTKGSKTVKVSGKEVMLKNKSHFKKSMGDEAGSAAKKGVITSVNRGKVYFTAWSMDVKIEGQNVVRHFDLTTHNHMSMPGNSPPWPYMDSMAIDAQGNSDDPCAAEKQNEQKACQEYRPNNPAGEDACEEAGLAAKKKRSKEWAQQKSKRANSNKCIAARRCRLVQYKPDKEKPDTCCRSQTPDHLIPKSSFYKEKGKQLDSWHNYNPNKAPCMCSEGTTNTHGNHGLRHAHHKANGPNKGTMQSFDEQADLAAEGAAQVHKGSGCSKKCIKAQIENGHKGMGAGDVKHNPSGKRMTNEEITSQAAQYSPTVTSR